MGGLFSPRSSICVRPLVMLPLVPQLRRPQQKKGVQWWDLLPPQLVEIKGLSRQKRERRGGKFGNAVRRLLVIPTVCCQVPSRPQAAGWAMVETRDQKLHISSVVLLSPGASGTKMPSLPSEQVRWSVHCSQALRLHSFSCCFAFPSFGRIKTWAWSHVSELSNWATD